MNANVGTHRYYDKEVLCKNGSLVVNLDGNDIPLDKVYHIEVTGRANIRIESPNEEKEMDSEYLWGIEGIIGTLRDYKEKYLSDFKKENSDGCGIDGLFYPISGRFIAETLDIITRLQSEKAQLTYEVKCHTEANQQLLNCNECQKAEIERLTEENGWLSKECNKATAECAELKKQGDKLENRFENKAFCNMSENCSMVQQAVKDRTIEIIAKIKERLKYLDNEWEISNTLYPLEQEYLNDKSAEVE